ncbi:MAG: cell division protein FtsQ [Marmoricola sp.]|nr:cell division protein FtsQ [Marmoricola sp.]
MTMSEEHSVVVAKSDFRRRRMLARLRRFRPLLYVVGVVLLVALGAWAIYFSSWVTVHGVDVTGTKALSSARVTRVADVPTGRPLARVDLAAIQARVEAIPAVRSAAVSRSWPHTIHIAITERTPVAVVSRGAGLQAVDEDGVLFGSYARAPANLPLVRTAPDVKADALAEAARVVTSLRADIVARVAHVDVVSVDAITLDLRDGTTVLWGSADQSAQKAEVLAILLRKHPQHIDVSVPGRPTTR